jgi:hypothetical protein
MSSWSTSRSGCWLPPRSSTAQPATWTPTKPWGHSKTWGARA